MPESSDAHHLQGSGNDPGHIRERAGLLPHTEVEFEFDGETVRIVRAGKGQRPSRGEEFVRRLRGSGTVQMTTDEIMALTRGED